MKIKIQYTKWQKAAKAKIRGKFIALYEYIAKVLKSHI